MSDNLKQDILNARITAELLQTKHRKPNMLTRRILVDHNNIDTLNIQQKYDTYEPWEIKMCPEDITLLSFRDEEECIKTFRKILDSIHKRHKTVVILSPQKIELNIKQKVE